MHDARAAESAEFARNVPFASYEIPVDPVTGKRKELGRGGMGVTYKARHAKLGRLVVLKVILPSALEDKQEQVELTRLRFFREAKALSLLEHPSIPRLYDYGEVGGEEYYAMEFIRGEDLAARLKRVTALSVEDALEVTEQVARALGAAHRAGIVHRDVKPANLMLTRSEDGAERVKLIDFGLAKGDGTGVDLGASSRGAAGMTPLYASPEQCQQQPATARSDLYSLGVVLWVLLTGRAPFGGTSVFEVCRGHVSAPPPVERLPADLPASVRELLLHLLEKKPERRPETADEVAGQLAQIRRNLAAAAGSLGSAPTVRPDGPVTPPGRPLGPPRWLLGLASVGAAGLLGWFGANAGWFRPGPGGATASTMPTPPPTTVPAPTAVPTTLPTPRPTPLPTPQPTDVPTATPRPAPTVTPTPVRTAYERFAGEKAGDRRLIGGIPFRWCPPGDFVMGEENGVKGAKAHPVRLTKGFWLAETELTQAQWQAVTESNPSKFKGSDLPVETVSWDEAMAWCGEANGRSSVDGWEWTLPTEAQWEYACRAGAEPPTEWSFGNDLSSKLANFNGSYPGGKAAEGPDLQKPVSVGSYPANAWGFHDLHGNVWEWCRDAYEDEIIGRIVKTGTLRVFRGGGWLSNARNCRSAYRDGFTRGFRYGDLGFRPAVVPSDP